MKNDKLKKLEQNGWKVGSASDFLGLSRAEETFVEMKLALAKSLRHCRTSRELTQAQAARILGSSQSRVAKMEAGDSTVSLDLLVRALLALGAAPAVLARAITSASAVAEESPPYEAKTTRKRKPA
jgi:predicted XRE-type DNA-binding protein